MASRPTVAVQGKEGSSLPLPAVFTAPIRLDIVQLVHKSMNKNKRQAYSVSEKAGHQTSAESWGTGRAVARIPRVGGGGTHRSGQAAFGNMCRGGRMFAPTKTWRKWHVKIAVNQRRFATTSAIAASALPSLLLARGHRITEVPEVPLVVPAQAEAITKTKEAVALLKSVGAYEDVIKADKSKTLRAGKGKMRNRRYVQRRGPLVIHASDDMTKAFRNLPGVEVVHVSRLNLLQLAPGGHLGRFIVWTEPAFAQLDKVFGTFDAASQQKKDYFLPTAKIANPDLTSIINSTAIQSALTKAAGDKAHKRPWTQKKNPLKNRGVLYRLNPYAKVLRKQAIEKQKAAADKKKAAKSKKESSAGAKFLEQLHAP